MSALAISCTPIPFVTWAKMNGPLPRMRRLLEVLQEIDGAVKRAGFPEVEMMGAAS